MPRGGARPRRPSVRPRCPARPASASHGICRALLVDNLGRPSDESTTTIERTWTRFPGRAYAQAELVEELRRWVPAARLGLAKQLFLRSGVTQRHFAVPPAEMLARGRSFAAKNDRYKRAVREQVSALCRTIAGTTTPEERATVDLLATASCTGFQIPAMDALVIDELRLPRGARRLNLTQHGCAAGAAAIGVAHEWLAARPRGPARGLCSELCWAAFQPEDTSDENIVSAAIFGDGAAAVLLAGRGVPVPGPRIVVRDSIREIFAGTEHFMGFDVDEAGLKIKLSRDVVRFAELELPALFARACARWGIAGPVALTTGAVHPGGRRILEVLEDAVGLSRAVTATSWQCLERYGNLSSVSVLCALDRLVREPPAAGALGLLSAFGPGFGAELALLEHRPGE